jgi:hypothetical protein
VEGVNDNPLLEGKHVDETEVKCLNCGWEGKQKDLYLTDMSASLAGEDDADAIAKALATDLLGMLYTNSSEFLGTALVAVGLVPQAQLKEEQEALQDDRGAYTPVLDMVTRMVRAGVLGAWKSILQEMSAIEKISAAARQAGVRPNFKLEETDEGKR